MRDYFVIKEEMKPDRLDVSLLGRDSEDFSGTLGTFVTLGTFFLWKLWGLYNIMHPAQCIKSH